MIHLFQTLQKTLLAGQEAVLCTIVSRSGSAPRGAGAKMLVFADGSGYETIGGGAVEYAAMQQALQLLRDRKPALRTYTLTNDQAAGLGMVCGGSVQVLFQHFDAGRLPLVEAILARLETEQDGWLSTTLTDENDCMEVLDASPVPTPLWQPPCFTEPLSRGERVYVFGGGHVSQALVPVLARLGFRITVMEERPQFVDPALFPDAEQLLLGSYWSIGETVRIRPEDYAVIMTRGHQGDYALLEQILRCRPSYVGCIGSRKKVAYTAQRLRDAGIPEADIAAVHSPIGLEIGAETPAEIAVSIAAQLIQHRRSQP